MKSLELRKKIKSKKPKFLRQDGHKKAKLKNVWRAPKGRQSKMRLKKKGKRKQPSLGYSSPKEVRGLSPKGLKPIMINNIHELSNIKEGEGIILSGKIGNKKRLEIIKKIQELKLNLLNINAEDYLKKIQEKLEKKKESKKEKLSKKEKTKKELEKKTKEKKKEETVEKTEEEKEKKEKEEKKKVLEKRK